MSTLATVNRSSSDRLRRLIEAELKRRGITGAEAAREARLPASVFQSLRRGQRPTIDRADELCRSVGISMTIGFGAPDPRAQPDDNANGS